METIEIKDMEELKDLVNKSDDNTIFHIKLNGGGDDAGKDSGKSS